MITVASHFDEIARTSSAQVQDRIAVLKRTIQRTVPGLFSDWATILCRPDPTGCSAQTFPSHGVVFVFQEFLLAAPVEVVTAVAVHEAAHLWIGNDLRDAVAAKHPEAFQLLHRSVIPDWRAGRIEPKIDEEYLDSKGWSDLYLGWSGPTNVDVQRATDAANAYFDQLIGGFIDLDRFGLSTFPVAALDIAPKRPSFLRAGCDVAREYQAIPDQIAIMIMTGFDLLHYLRDCLQSSLSIEFGTPLWMAEEAFANFLSANMTGVSFDKLQRWAPQDRQKIDLAVKVQRSGVTAQQVLEATRTLRGLGEMARHLGIGKPG